MGGLHRSVPLFIVCRRLGCDQLREVRRPHLQRKGGYCSRRCAAIATQNIAHADHAQGGRTSGRRRRARIATQLRGLSKLAVFRLGYARGLQATWRARRAALGRRLSTAVTTPQPVAAVGEAPE